MSTLADEVERVEYVFEGDISSLRTATQTAINLLNKYSNSMREASNTDAFKASQRSTKSMSASINRLTKDVTRMQGQLKGVADVKLPKGSSSFKAMEDTLSTLNSQMQKLNSTDTITTKTLTNFRAGIESARASIQASSPQVDALVAKELKFQRVLDTVKEKATQLRGALASMRGSTSNIFDPATIKTSKLGGTLSNLSTRVSSVFTPITSKMSVFTNIFDRVSAKIQSFKDKASTTFSRVGQIIRTVSDAFRRTSESTDSTSSSMNRAASAHKNFENTAAKMASSVEKETKAIKNEQTSLESKTPTVEKSTESHNNFLTVLSNLGNIFRTEIANSKTFNLSLKNLGSVTQLLTKAFSSLTGIAVGDWLANVAKESINYVENLNLFTVAMGNSIDKGLKFVDTMSEVYGMDPNNLYKYTGYFYQLTAAIGMAESASASMSLSMTKAANDIASLFNVDINTVVENLASGIQGFSRAVRKYGIDIRSTTLQQTALKYGISGTVSEMSEANRMALRYLTMMDQISNATQQVGTDANGATIKMGDFARTIEQPANQLRIFKEQVTQLGRAIGNFIVAPLRQALAYINGFIMALRAVINFIAGFFKIINTGISGIDTSGADDAADSVSSIGSAAGGAAEKLKDLMAPFDELNVLQEQTGGGGGGGGALDDVLDPSLSAAIEKFELTLENIQMKANQIRNTILEFLGFKIEDGEIISWSSEAFEENLIDKFPNWTKTIQAAFDSWEEIINGFKSVFESIGNVIEKVYNNIKSFISKFINDESVSKFISNLGDALEKLSDWIDKNDDKIANFVTILIALKVAFRALNILQPVIGKLMQFVHLLSLIPAPAVKVISILALVAGAIYTLYTNSEKFEESANNLFKGLSEGVKKVATSLINLFSTVIPDIISMWDTDIKPTIEAIGDALSPIVDTLNELWTLISGILSDTIDDLTAAWDDTIKPILENILKIIRGVCNIIKFLWEEIVGPTISYIIEGMSKLWNGSLRPTINKVLEILGKVIELITILWKNVIEPVIKFLVHTVGPVVKRIVNGIWDVTSEVINDIIGVLDGLLTALGGVLDFLAGVFTGDWDRAWHGLVNILVGVGNSIISVFESALNSVIKLVNLAISAIYNAFVALINTIMGAVEKVGEALGFEWDITIQRGPPQISPVSIPRIPEYANGGIVTSPTYALIGEGRYDEMILPLGNSPQMDELIQRIAEAVDKPDNKPDNSNPIEVRVFIGGDEYDAFTYRAAERGKKKVGLQPIKTGG